MDAFLAQGRAQREHTAAESSTGTSRSESLPPINPARHVNKTNTPQPFTSGYVPLSIPATQLLHNGLRSLNRPILSHQALRQDDNPITHSKTGERTLLVQSCATGHQTRNSNSSGGGWAVHRNAKLAVQAQARESTVFKGVVCYINGYTGSGAGDEDGLGEELGDGQSDVVTANSTAVGSDHGTARTWSNEMIKDAIERGGGVVRIAASARLTHILVSTSLSGSKAHKILTGRLSSLSSKIKLVDPRWVVDSTKAGRRLAETKYPAPVFSEAQPTVISALASAASSTDPKSASIQAAAAEELAFRRQHRHAASYESCADVPYAPTFDDQDANFDELLGVGPGVGSAGMRRARSTSALVELAKSLKRDRELSTAPVALKKTKTISTMMATTGAPKLRETVEENDGDSRPLKRPRSSTPSNRTSDHHLKASSSASTAVSSELKPKLPPARSCQSSKPRSAQPPAPSPVLEVLELVSSGGQGSGSSAAQDSVTPAAATAAATFELDDWEMPPSAQPCQSRR